MTPSCKVPSYTPSFNYRKQKRNYNIPNQTTRAIEITKPH